MAPDICIDCRALVLYLLVVHKLRYRGTSPCPRCSNQSYHVVQIDRHTRDHDVEPALSDIVGGIAH